MNEQATLEDFHTRDSTESESDADEPQEGELLERLEKIDRKVGVLYSLYGDLYSDLDDARDRGGFDDCGNEAGPETSSMFY